MTRAATVLFLILFGLVAPLLIWAVMQDAQTLVLVERVRQLECRSPAPAPGERFRIGRVVDATNRYYYGTFTSCQWTVHPMRGEVMEGTSYSHDLQPGEMVVLFPFGLELWEAIPLLPRVDEP